MVTRYLLQSPDTQTLVHCTMHCTDFYFKESQVNIPTGRDILQSINLHYGTTWQHYVTKQIIWSFMPDLFSILLIFKYAYFKSNTTPLTNKHSKINDSNSRFYTFNKIYCSLYLLPHHTRAVRNLCVLD